MLYEPVAHLPLIEIRADVAAQAPGQAVDVFPEDALPQAAGLEVHVQVEVRQGRNEQASVGGQDIAAIGDHRHVFQVEAVADAPPVRPFDDGDLRGLVCQEQRQGDHAEGQRSGQEGSGT